MNSITLVGRLGRDPSVRKTSNNVDVAELALAVDRKKGGEKKTDWFKVICFGRNATVAAEYLSKGKQVAVTGAMVSDEYSKDGQKKTVWEVHVDRLHLMGSSDGQKVQGRATSHTPGQATPPPDLNDEIPF